MNEPAKCWFREHLFYERSFRIDETDPSGKPALVSIKRMDKRMYWKRISFDTKRRDSLYELVREETETM